MVFCGISRDFSLKNEQQYETIGQFWDEMAKNFGLENLRGLGYNWEGGKISYAIGLKNGKIPDYNISIELPDENWKKVEGETERLQEIYNEIYKSGALLYEIETFFENGRCVIQYYRK